MTKKVIRPTRSTKAQLAAARAWFHVDDTFDPDGPQTSQDLQLFRALRAPRAQAERFVRTMAGDLLTDDEVQDILRDPETKESDQ